MGRQRDGREAAMQLLFAHDLHSEISDEERDAFWTLHSAKPAVRAHAEGTVKEVIIHLAEIDGAIAAAVQNFRVERLTSVDRNILRCAVYELLHLPKVPVPVVINEAIEISKKYGTEDSGKFVNGILDKIAKSQRAKANSTGADIPSSISNLPS